MLWKARETSLTALYWSHNTSDLQAGASSSTSLTGWTEPRRSAPSRSSTSWRCPPSPPRSCRAPWPSAATSSHSSSSPASTCWPTPSLHTGSGNSMTNIIELSTHLSNPVYYTAHYLWSLQRSVLYWILLTLLNALLARVLIDDRYLIVKVQVALAFSRYCSLTALSSHDDAGGRSPKTIYCFQN